MDNQNQGIVWDSQPTQSTQQPNITWDDQKPEGSEIQANPDADFADKAVHTIGGTFEGIGEGLFGTAAGAADLFGGKGSKVSDTLHHLAGDDQLQHGTAQNVGRGLETIGEFLLGDEALKGLSFADRLKKVSGVMKFLEGSPKLSRALSLGINIGKAGTQLGPEERALLKQYPTLARLVGLGLDSVRAGVVQGGQTLVKSGGDVGKAVKEGAGMAAGSAIIGAPLAGLGGMLEKGAQGAETVADLQKTAEAAPTAENLSGQLESSVRNTGQPLIDNAQATLDEANEKKAGIQSVAEGLGENAPTKQAITSKAQAAVQSAHDALNNQYIADASKIKGELEGNQIALKGSNIYKLAQDLTKLAEEQKDPMKDLFEIPNPNSKGVTTFLKRITAIADKEPKEGEKTPTLSADDLLSYAKKVKENLRNTGWQTAEDRADRDAYFQMLDAIHNDFGELADKAGKPEVRDALDAMNANYKTGIQRFSNPDVKKILQGEHEGNILKLLQGTGSVKDVQNIRNTIGKESYGHLVDNSIQRIAADAKDPATGEFDFNKFFKNVNSINPDVWHEMTQGTTKGGPLELALSQLRNLNASEVIPNSETTIKEATKLMDDMVGNGNVTKLINNPDKVRALNEFIGPDAMGELGKSVVMNQLREASTVVGKDGQVTIGPVKYDKFLDFINKFKDQPELVQTLFRSTPETAQAYDKLIQQVQDVKGVKNMIKYGIIAPAGILAGAAGGHLVGHAMFGALAAYWGERRAGQFLEWLANRPATWRAIQALDATGKKPIAQGVGMLSRYAAGKASADVLNRALRGTQTTLGQ